MENFVNRIHVPEQDRRNLIKELENKRYQERLMVQELNMRKKESLKNQLQSMNAEVLRQ